MLYKTHKNRHRKTENEMGKDQRHENLNRIVKINFG